MKNHGIIAVQGNRPVKATADLLAGLLIRNNIKIYARIDQQQEAKNAGITIAPMEYLLFGKPEKGGLVITANPLAALDLPLKVIIYEDDLRQVFIVYNDPAFIQERFLLSQELVASLDLAPLIKKLLII